MNFFVYPLSAPLAGDQPVEIVERKGLGHPDTICDALADDLSRRLCRFYMEKFGFIAHHNVDKALLWGGVARPAFRGGAVLEPMEIFLAGRATMEHRGIETPVAEMVECCIHDWFAKHMHAVDPDRHVRSHCLVRPGSADLVDLFERQSGAASALANDTSCGVGFAPLTGLERIVLDTERRLNGASVRRNFPEYGEDMKIMGVRTDDRIDLMLACAFVDSHVDDLSDYETKKARLAEITSEAANEISGGQYDITVAVNAADQPATGGIYLTVTGTSAESGDDGEVGRGNRANGLITPCRPMTMEAAAGKNPVSHVGKLYNVAAGRIAARLVEQLEPVEHAQCWLVSRIGQPINDPALVNVGLGLASGCSASDVSFAVEEIVHQQLVGLGKLYEEVIDGALSVY